MATPLKQKLVIEQGRTFKCSVRWEAETHSYAAISAISKAAPAVVTTALVHGLPDGWRAAIVSVLGMVEINALETPPAEAEYKRVTLVSATAVNFNEINAALFTTYVSGGYLQFFAPIDMTGYTARLAIKDKVGGVVLATLTTENGGISIDNTQKRIVLTISATATAGFTWKAGVYDLEMVSPGGEIKALIYGAVSVTPEVTT